MSPFDDDDLDPPPWVNWRHPPEEHAPSPRPTGRSRRDASHTATRQGGRGSQPARPTRPATRGRRPPADRGGDLRGRRDDGEFSRPSPEPPRRQRMARRDAERTDRRRRRRRTILVLAIVLLPIVLVLAAGGWFVYQLNPPGDPGRKVAVTIPEDAGTGRIGDLLEDKGVIGSSTVFQIFTKVTGSGPFKPGRYSMREDLGVRDAVNRLKAGPAKAPDVRLDLPPGLTLSQIADRVGQLPGRNRDAFLAAAQSGAVRSKYQPPEVASLEGLLFPDTYFIGENETDEQILTRLVTAFDQQADGAGLAVANTSGLNPYQTVIAASLIEREAKVDEDRPLISAVIRNRLVSGVPLQIDATVCYAKGGCDKAPTRSDLAIDSPFNTYKVQGLPPTPISSVGAKALAAAAKPADVPYLYYVLIDENGKHKFATTGEEHERNMEEARQKGLL